MKLRLLTLSVIFSITTCHNYISNDARIVLVNEITSKLYTIAKDVKFKIEFNPAHVTEYRLIG